MNVVPVVDAMATFAFAGTVCAQSSMQAAVPDGDGLKVSTVPMPAPAANQFTNDLSCGQKKTFTTSETRQ